MSDCNIDGKRDIIVTAMRKRGRFLVAFSGGVDSGLVLRLAHDAIGDCCLAVIADSPSLPRRELEAARKMADEIGTLLKVVRLHEMEREDYLQNSGLRCYFCRTELARELRALAVTDGFNTIADGANASDLGDYRPGMKASDENGFWHPLIEFGVTKEMVRAMAKELGLSWHDKPSSPCLSSRIMTGERITEKKLRMIEAGEDLLHDMGYGLVRVRNIRGAARIEVSKEDLPKMTEVSTFDDVEGKLKELGFLSVTVDPLGYRQGSMNRRF
jgi:uncharacterized protein